MEYLNKTILNYRITRVIGEGGMATVYEAVHKTFSDRKVAVKILNPILTANKNIRQRFENEAKIMASLVHPNIVQVLDYVEQEDTLAILMELLEGNSLTQYIKNKGALSPAETRDIMLPVLSAFTFAHNKNVVHRDIKPSNIFILQDGTPKILDFGIAKMLEGSHEITKSGIQMGTLAYMSPEQVKDSKHVDLRSDIYSLGVSLYYMLAGEKPYDTTTMSDFDLRLAIVQQPFPKLKNNTQFQEIIETATAKEPKDRFQTCQEFKDAILNPDFKGNKPIPDKPPVNNDKTLIDDSNKPDLEETVIDSPDNEATIVETPVTSPPPVQPKPKPTPKVKNKPKTKKKRTGLWIAAILLLVVISTCLQVTNKSNPDTETNISGVEEIKVPEMVFISGGTFQMGSNYGAGDEKPVHSVTVSDFYIGKYEVTFEEYDAFCDATGRNKPDDEGWGRGNRPVINVSWEDADAYCKWLSTETGKTYRLPTEAEWEYAAGGGSTHREYAGTNSESSLGDYAWYGDNSGGKTHPVGTKNPNSYGLYDMNGNVWEWCNDWYGDYSSSSQTNPQGANSGSYRVLRGGSWGNIASGCRVANRSGDYPAISCDDLGFRVAARF